MITEEMKKEILGRVRNLSAEEMVAQLEKIGSVRASADSSFNLHRFLDEEENRLLGAPYDGWFFVESFCVDVKGIAVMYENHLCNGPQDGLAA